MDRNRKTAAVVSVLASLGVILFFGATVQAEEKEGKASVPLTQAEMEKAQKIYFDRCAGCHGTLRKGATGPDLLPERMMTYGTETLKAIITHGTPGGMPNWGEQGILSPEETELMAKYIQNIPPAPPEMSLADMKATWKIIVPVDKRPKKPEHTRNWENFFSVTLRDAGEVAIIDGDTKEIVNIVKTGFAVHISRPSGSGRYIFTIGRDGRATMIDLWMEVPDKVAEVKTCSDARSIETSKYKGKEGDFIDRYAVVGCYWPPHFVILNGATMEPLKVVSTRSYTYDTGEFHPEPRVASIVASHFKPEWIINIKETGQTWLVDYSDLKNLRMTEIETERFLHDGGWDSTGRYFLVAANMANKIAVVDAKEGKLVKLVDVAKKPHPGRGANWVDPVYGPVWGTSHLGEGVISVIGTDPEKHPQNAWKVVRSIDLVKKMGHGGGSLFVKTHPKSRWIWVDFALNPDVETQHSLCVMAKADPDKDFKCWKVSDAGRAVHLEYNKTGTEVWVSVWGKKDGKSEIVVYDDKTLKEVKRIQDPRIITPTGKFNVYNTVHDIY